MAVVDEEINL